MPAWEWPVPGGKCLGGGSECHRGSLVPCPGSHSVPTESSSLEDACMHSRASKATVFSSLLGILQCSRRFSQSSRFWSFLTILKVISTFGSIFEKLTFQCRNHWEKSRSAKDPVLIGRTRAKGQVTEQHRKGRVRVRRNQEKEYINEKRMSLAKPPDWFPCVGNHFSSLNRGGVRQPCWKTRDRGASVLARRMTLCLPWGPLSPAVAPGTSLPAGTAEAASGLGGLSQEVELPTLAHALGGFVGFFVFVLAFISTPCRGS